MKLLLLMCWGLLTCATVMANDDTMMIEQRLNRFLAGVSSGDRSVHEWFWADDLVYTSSSGLRFGKAEILAPVDTDAEQSSQAMPTYRAEEVDIRVYGDAAVLAFQLVSETPSGTDASPDIARYYNTGTLLKRDGVWKVVAWQATRVPEPQEG